MKKTSILGLMLIALLAFQGVASAKTVSGKIAGVDVAGNKLSITDEAAAKVDISVSKTTTYAGAASLADLTVGQEVSVEAEDAAGVLSATSVKIAEPVKEVAPAQPLADAPATKEPAQ